MEPKLANAPQATTKSKFESIMINLRSFEFSSKLRYDDDNVGTISLTSSQAQPREIQCKPYRCERRCSGTLHLTIRNGLERMYVTELDRRNVAKIHGEQSGGFAKRPSERLQ